jgi:hypothetical protein
MPACGPAFRVFRALRQCVSGLNLARQVPHVSMLAFVLSDDLFRLTSSAIFSDAWPATHGTQPLVWYNGCRAARILMRNAYGVNSPGLAKPASPCYGPARPRQRL